MLLPAGRHQRPPCARDERSITTAAITAATALVLSRLIQKGFPASGLGPTTRPLLLLWFENPCQLSEEPR